MTCIFLSHVNSDHPDINDFLYKKWQQKSSNRIESVPFWKSVFHLKIKKSYSFHSLDFKDQNISLPNICNTCHLVPSFTYLSFVTLSTYMHDFFQYYLNGFFVLTNIQQSLSLHIKFNNFWQRMLICTTEK